MRTFEEIKDELDSIMKYINLDPEGGHIECDKILREIALRDDLTLEQRKELVSIYDRCGECFWYA